MFQNNARQVAMFIKAKVVLTEWFDQQAEAVMFIKLF